jgi:hypothetical protein
VGYAFLVASDPLRHKITPEMGSIAIDTI